MAKLPFCQKEYSLAALKKKSYNNSFILVTTIAIRSMIRQYGPFSDR